MREKIVPWLGQRLGSGNFEVLSLRSAGAGSSAESYVAMLRATDNTPREFGVVLRRQNDDGALFLESSLELPCMAMEQVSKASGGAIPVPRVYGLETDPTVLGAPFIIMEQLPGRIIQQSPNYNREGWLADLPTAGRARVWCNALRMMARINRLDVGQEFGFLDRPARGSRGLDQYLHWVEEWYRWARADRPHRITDIAIERLKAKRPRQAPVALLWGDPQTSNFLFDEAGEISGVLDWEMATLGPPEADLAWWLFFDDLFSAGMRVPRLAGLPDRRECIAIYEEALGRRVQDLEYYNMLAAFRMATVGMRSVDRQIKRGLVPATSTARENAPIVALLAGMLGEPPPEVGADFHHYLGTLGMAASLAKERDGR